ncbi:MAG: multidrug ABC transporter ATP-binding protein [Terriglobia bacterium]|nr:MAG: multidrug ABC transporter ATP-binding protein [Terriglobia bacterium]
MISCRELTKRFGAFSAVDNLSFEVAPGSICAFLGPNGAGKSTTVKMLTGLVAPTSGEAIVCGLDVHRDSLAIKRKIGVLPEDLGLFDDLTVEEHLELTGRLYGLSRDMTAARTTQLLRALNLTDGRDTFAGHCSHGMRKKTAFAMVLLPNPEVLFLDEPFEAIDPVTSKIMHEMLVLIATRGVTVFLTSHILSVVERIAHQIVIIRGGKMVWNSSAEELPASLEELYFDLAESPATGELEWLGSARS